ncbi:unnamed protein product [Pedinophyceae sp. YPF-701]|nr:unnamed protein product [Pedinophyceae sp. YPF-701]
MCRWFAVGGGGKGKGLRKAKQEFGQTAADAPVSILKGEPNPQLLPDDQYPDWLWTLLDPKPTLTELKAKEPDLTVKELKRMMKLMNRQHIKDNNVAGKK